MDSSFDEQAESVTVAPGRALRPRLSMPRILDHDLAAPVLAVSALAVAVATQFAIVRHADIPRVGLGFVLAGLLFAGAALSVNRAQRSATEAAPFELTRRWEIGVLLAIIALAAFFRFFRFMEFPPGLWYDEAVNGTDALWIIDHSHLTVWRSSNFGHSTIFFYLLIASFKVFGYTVFAMRLVPALAGMAAVVAFYFLARWLLSPVPALVATALLAVSRYAVTFSRISWEASLQPLLEIMAVYFFVRAIETKSKFQFFMAGGSLAAGIYTYLAFRFVPFVLLFFLVYIAVTQWRLLRANIPGLIVYAVSFLVVVAPLGQFAIRNQDLFLARTRAINVFKEIDQKNSYDPLKSNIEATFEMMNVAGDKNGRHNLPKAPMLDGISAALLALGVAVSLWSIRNWRKGGMLGWLVLAVAPGAFTISIENPSAIRTIGAIPPLFLLTGMAVSVLYGSLARTRSGLFVFGLLALAMVAASAGINYYDFYERQANSKEVYDGFQPPYTRVGEIVADHADAERVMISGEFNHPAIQVLGRGKKFGDYDPSRDLVLARGGKDALLILDTRQFSLIPALLRLYPNLSQQEFVDPFGRVWFTRVTVPASDINALHQLPLTVHEGPDASGPVISSGKSDVTKEWTAADLGPGGTVTAVWDAYLWTYQPTVHGSVSVEAPGDIAIELDGKRVASGNGSVKASELAMERGQHVVKIIATIKAAGASAIDFYDERGPAAVEAADAFYGISAGDHGFEVIYHEQQDFAARVVATGRMPFAVPTDPLPTSQAIEYRGVLNASSPGEYGFALDGANSVQLFVDDELVVDNGGSHASRRIEGAVELTPGPHLVSIQYLATTRPDWAVFFKTPDGDWKRADGSEFDPPTTAYVPAALAALKPDDSWGGARKFDKLEAPQAVTVLRDGTLVVGSRDTLGFIGQDGQVLRTLKLDSAVDVTDLASGPNGEIIAGDRASKTLLVLNGDGDLIRTINGPFDSIAGIDAGGDSVVVVSPAGGMVYSVPLAGGAPTLLPMSAADAPVRAAQPSDVVSAPDGTMYAADFEKHKIVIVPPGRPARVVNGVTGVGAQVPHMAIYKKLLLVTDPTGSRVVIYDSSGKQRGVFVFPAKAEGTRPVGIAITPDGYVYIADATGFVYRLGISAPPELTN